MSVHPSWSPLFDFSGWVIKEIKTRPKIAMIRLRRDKRLSIRCPYCYKRAGTNRKVWQSVSDLPLGIASIVKIHYEAIQGFCACCERYFTIVPHGFDHAVRATRRLMHYVCRLCRFMPASKVSEFLPISASTARRWDKKVLAEHLPEPDLDSLRYVIVDEKSIGKGHNYLTVVINGETGEVLHLAEGKKKESFESFFARLSATQINNIKAIAMDRAGAYKAVAQEQAPKAEIVFDKFHIIANLNQAIDEVRRNAWREASKDDKRFIKGQRYNLFRHPENLREDQASDLALLFEINKPLFQAYLLKDALRKLWTYVYPGWAGKYLDKWIYWVNESGLTPLVKFAKGLDRDRAKVLACIKHRITSAKLEAFNGIIDRIVRKACGYRDLEYLYLKIRQEATPPVLQT